MTEPVEEQAAQAVDAPSEPVQADEQDDSQVQLQQETAVAEQDTAAEESADSTDSPQDDQDKPEYAGESHAPAQDAESSQPDQQQAEEPEPPQISLEEAAAAIEAILFSTDSPMPATKILQVAELPSMKYVRQSVKLLNERYEQINATFRIETVASGYQMLTLSTYHDILDRLFKVRSDSKLSATAMETLAIVAYRQPILRADIEAIRGVACGEVLRKLMEKQLIKIVGRAEVLGRPMLYGTTRRFLEIFGLASLDDLPRVEELRTPLVSADKKSEKKEEKKEDKTEQPSDQAETESSEASDEKQSEAQPQETQQAQSEPSEPVEDSQEDQPQQDTPSQIEEEPTTES